MIERYTKFPCLRKGDWRPVMTHCRDADRRPRRLLTGVLRSRCLPLAATLPFHNADFKIGFGRITLA
jgi:hypothetical protein